MRIYLSWGITSYMARAPPQAHPKTSHHPLFGSAVPCGISQGRIWSTKVLVHRVLSNSRVQGASPGAPHSRPAATRQNAPRRAKVQRVVTELSDVDLSDIEESDDEGEDEGEKLRQKSRPKATPRPLPGGRRKNGSHKQHNPW